ncbi:PAS domain S-box protein, partial [Streptomyces carpinensis]
MGDAGPPEAVSRRFPEGPASAASARRFVGAALRDVPSDLSHTAQLLVSELVTNAVLHARTEVEVGVRVHGGRVRVRVTDQRPSRGLVRQDCPPYAGTGQGLALVEHLASRHGVHADDRQKTVWFELWPGGPPPPSPGWEAGVPPGGAEETVTLVDVPSALYSATQQHRHTLLRELTLAAFGGDDLGVRPGDLATANDVNNVLSACVTAALEEPLPDADVRSLSLAMPADVAPALLTLRRVLDLAEEAAREERLLTLPALPRSRVFQEWLFDQITCQLAGDHPTAWTVLPREPDVSPSELAAWDAGHLRASTVPTIAADEGNRIIAANGPAADMLGWQVDDLVGRRLTTLIPEHLRQRHLVAFSSLLLTGRTRIMGRSVPLPALHHDGRTVPVRLHIQNQEMADGSTVFVAQLTPRATTSVDAPSPPGAGRVVRAVHEPGVAHVRAVGERGRRTGDAGGGMSAVERLALLADAGAELNNTLDLDEGLARVGRLLTQRLADWFVVDLFTEYAQVERVCIVRGAPRGPRPAAYEGRLPPLSEASRG